MADVSAMGLKEFKSTVHTAESDQMRTKGSNQLGLGDSSLGIQVRSTQR